MRKNAGLSLISPQPLVPRRSGLHGRVRAVGPRRTSRGGSKSDEPFRRYNRKTGVFAQFLTRAAQKTPVDRLYLPNRWSHDDPVFTGVRGPSPRVEQAAADRNRTSRCGAIGERPTFIVTVYKHAYTAYTRTIHIDDDNRSVFSTPFRNGSSDLRPVCSVVSVRASCVRRNRRRPSGTDGRFAVVDGRKVPSPPRVNF
jgi:hypothetical protein